jgi:hypothetical protein
VNLATDIVQSGSTFTFSIPQGQYPQFAFATASGDDVAHFFPSEPARNIPMKVTINDGFIVAISYPHGLPNGTGILLHKATWRLSDFGLAPPVIAPSESQ